MFENENIIRNSTVDCILSRRSVRAYKDEPLTAAQLETVLYAGLWAPSGRNSQPLTVRALTGKDRLDALNADFWRTVGPDAKPYSRCDVNPVYQTAPALILMFSESGAYTDAGIAAENMALAAKSLGLGSVIIASVGALFDGEYASKWKKTLEVPEEMRFLLAVAVGVPDEDPPVKPRDAGKYRIIGE